MYMRICLRGWIGSGYAQGLNGNSFEGRWKQFGKQERKNEDAEKLTKLEQACQFTRPFVWFGRNLM
jgi:hypothetical protein